MSRAPGLAAAGQSGGGRGGAGKGAGKGRGGGPLPRRPGARTFARLAAVQALYQIEQNSDRPANVIAEFERHRLAPPHGDAAAAASEAAADAGTTQPARPMLDDDEPGEAPADELPALEADRSWFRDIVAGACDRREEIDGLINRALEGRREVARMEVTLRAILRAGVYELLARIDTPTAVVITEYVALSYDFFSKTEADLVHAILDRIGREVRHGA
ncbi:transcription antitermination factor NusB [Marinibaculum pumilum]|uniref:Transcription antitermination protein NusB n=1 Tax=Marinibaculum pumilum TaxID=1766165 RepID=A0ABV7KTW9_9PROT